MIEHTLTVSRLSTLDVVSLGSSSMLCPTSKSGNFSLYVGFTWLAVAFAHHRAEQARVARANSQVHQGRPSHSHHL